jgi:hypothetical protein
MLARRGSDRNSDVWQMLSLRYGATLRSSINVR